MNVTARGFPPEGGEDYAQLRKRPAAPAAQTGAHAHIRNTLK
jgi:hypothetical protein